MKKLKSLIALLLVALLALGCVACSSSTPTTADPQAPASADGEPAADDQPAADAGKLKPSTSGKADNSLTIAINDQPTTLDPDLFLLSIEDSIISAIYEPLFYIDNDGNYMWCVAESMTQNDDGSVTFTLKDGLTFHSGDTLAMEDIQYSFERSQYSALCSVLSQAVVLEVVDDKTFTMSFPMAEQGYGYDALRPYIQVMKILNKSFCEEHITALDEDLKFNTDGTGPYKFVEKKDNGDVTLTRNDNYYQDVAIETLKYKFISGSLETAFEAGDIDIASYTASNFKLLEQYSNVDTMTFSANNVTMLINNCTEGAPTADPNVRQAVVYALNREDICAIGSCDAGTPAYNLANPQIKYWEDGICTKYEMNIDKANELLAQAGYSASNKCELTLIVMGANTDWVSACEVMKETLEQANFIINIEQVADSSRYFTYDFDLGMISIALTTNFNSYADLYNMNSGLDIAGIDDPDVTAAFNSMVDKETTQAAMKIATESNAYIPLFYNTYFYAFDGDLNHGPMYTEFSGFLYRDFSWKD